MTANEMKYAAKVIFESIDSDDAPSFTDGEWGVILSFAQHSIVLDILKEGLSENEQSRVAIQALIKSGSNSVVAPIDSTSVYDNAYTFTLDPNVNDVWIALDLGVDTDSINNIEIKPISFDFYRKNINNPFRKPDIDDKFWGLYESGNNIIVITDGTPVTNLRFEYVDNLEKYPILPDPTAEVDCILHSSIHKTIVSKAGALAHLYVQDPQGYQMQVTENKDPGMFYLFR